MKAYSTTSARIGVVRKEGFYMSHSCARRVAKKLAAVFVLDEKVVSLLRMYLEGYNVGERLSYYSSGNEMEAFRRLSEWYSIDEDSPVALEKVYVAVDLNSGRALVIMSTRDLSGSEAVASLQGMHEQSKRERGLSENRLDGSNPKG